MTSGLVACDDAHVHRNGDKDLLKQLTEEMFLFDGDQIPEWSSI